LKHILLPLALISLPGCGALFGPPATLEETLELAAGFLNRHWAEELSPELGKVRVESEVIGKDTLVLRILDTPTGYETADPNHFRKILRRDVCGLSSVREVFERGGKIRVEIISNIGVEAAAFQLAQC
jgi:hypothetical protein